MQPCLEKSLGSFSANLQMKNGDDKLRDNWGFTMFFDTIVGDDEVVEYLQTHKKYVECFDLYE